jgi:hypothetical protein
LLNLSSHILGIHSFLEEEGLNDNKPRVVMKHSSEWLMFLTAGKNIALLLNLYQNTCFYTMGEDPFAATQPLTTRQI